MDVFLLKDGSLAIAHQKDLEISEHEIENMDLNNFEKT